MKKISTKFVIFLLPLLFLINLPKVIPFTFHEDLNRKINTLIDKDETPEILIAGDSRAERQLMPTIIENRLGKQSVNIAVNSGDISMLFNALKKNNLIAQDKTLIISVSSIEVNDNVINKWGVPHASVVNISLNNNIKLFGLDYLEVLHDRIRLMFFELFDKDIMLNEDDDRIETRGFMGIDGDISHWDFNSIDLNENTLKVGWYLDSVHDGVRKKVFEKEMQNLAHTDMNIILFQPPVSPSWYLHTKNTYIDSIELDHSEYLKNIASQYKNVSFIDFYPDYNSTFQDSMFYNSIHLNRIGAGIFSKNFCNIIIEKNLINNSNMNIFKDN